MRDPEQQPSLRHLRVDQLRPNSSNPNRMSKEDFGGYIAEVRRLGRLPKPIVVRPVEGGYYEIIDGEHGWRAAKQLGFVEVLCEVQECDDFEALRQTYKRNRGGRDDPVLLGRMFERMMEARGLSRRGLAAEIDKSEGTVRNALLYSEAAGRRAAHLRSAYAAEGDRDLAESAGPDISALSLEDVRFYLGLPVTVGNAWIDAGGTRRLLDGGMRVEYRIGRRVTVHEYPSAEWLSILTEVAAAGLDVTVESSLDGFQRSLPRALGLLSFRRRASSLLAEAEVDRYLQPLAAALKETPITDPAPILDELPITGEAPHRVVISHETWTEILENAGGEGAKSGIGFAACVALRVRDAVEATGISEDELLSARDRADLLDGPEFIRTARISIRAKLRLIWAEYDGAPAELVLEGKRRICAELERRDELLTGKATPAPGERMRLKLDGYDIEREFERTISRLLIDCSIHSAGDEQRLGLPNGATKLLLQELDDTEELGGRAARAVLRERLERLLSPERLLLAELVYGPFARRRRAVRHWLAAMQHECELSAQVAGPEYGQPSNDEDEGAHP